MTFLLLSMAGIPLTAGFTGKFVVFRAAYHVAGPLVVIALICSAIAAFFYLRIVVMMFFAEPPENGPTIAIPRLSTTSRSPSASLVTVVLGVFPQPVLDLADKAAKLTRVTPSQSSGSGAGRRRVRRRRAGGVGPRRSGRGRVGAARRGALRGRVRRRRRAATWSTPAASGSGRC